MAERHLVSVRSGKQARAPRLLTARRLQTLIESWILDGEIRQLTEATLTERRYHAGKLLWFLADRGIEAVDADAVRAYLAYVANGHTDTRGRWGNPGERQPAKRSTVNAYYRVLRNLCRYLVEEEQIDVSPMERIRAPQISQDQVRPFTEFQVEALLRAAKRGTHPRRDEAIVLFLLDTGCRASELCGLQIRHVELPARRCIVQGKGVRQRVVPMGAVATKALLAYLREEERDECDALFASDRGERAGEALRPNGLLQLIERLGTRAGIQGVRCSPHTFRHTFAVMFLRNGGNVFTLQQILGHRDLAMTNRYVALAQADIERQHRSFSPADRIKRP